MNRPDECKPPRRQERQAGT